MTILLTIPINRIARNGEKSIPLLATLNLSKKLLQGANIGSVNWIKIFTIGFEKSLNIISAKLLKTMAHVKRLHNQLNATII